MNFRERDTNSGQTPFWLLKADRTHKKLTLQNVQNFMHFYYFWAHKANFNLLQGGIVWVYFVIIELFVLKMMRKNTSVNHPQPYVFFVLK